MSATTLPSSSASAWLRVLLWTDAATVVALGALLLLAGNALAPLFGLPATGLRAAGVLLLGFAALIGWINVRGAPTAGVRLVIVANALWAIGTPLLLTWDGLAPTALGTAFVLGQAAAGGAITVLEHLALRRRDGLA